MPKGQGATVRSCNKYHAHRNCLPPAPASSSHCTASVVRDLQPRLKDDSAQDFWFSIVKILPRPFARLLLRVGLGKSTRGKKGKAAEPGKRCHARVPAGARAAGRSSQWPMRPMRVPLARLRVHRVMMHLQPSGRHALRPTHRLPYRKARRRMRRCARRPRSTPRRVSARCAC